MSSGEQQSYRQFLLKIKTSRLSLHPKKLKGFFPDPKSEQHKIAPGANGYFWLGLDESANFAMSVPLIFNTFMFPSSVPIMMSFFSGSMLK
jgi:hypothetical protein